MNCPRCLHPMNLYYRKLATNYIYPVDSPDKANFVDQFWYCKGCTMKLCKACGTEAVVPLTPMFHGFDSWRCPKCRPE